MRNYENLYQDWRVWILILLIILVLLWLFYGGDKEDFEGLNFLIDRKRKKPLVKKRGRMTSKGEEQCRKILEEHFDRKFPPDNQIEWLKNPETNRFLEIDCYNKELGIGLEFQGRQHYSYTPAFHRDENEYIQQVRRDDLKKRLCKENYVWLIIVSYKIPEKDRNKFILDSLPERVGINKGYSNQDW